jgi:deoxyribodipyrimidine photolyase-related protein
MDSPNAFLFHSVITPALNIGLITPHAIVSKAISFAEENNIPQNSLEGFIRQVIGWREFIRLIYIKKGEEQRTINYWKFNKKIPASFYSGTTGIEPVDIVIKRVIENSYCHHIERLMILGNFMLLCEIDPDEVYKWFMEMFIDSYDWVMVPNVYGMSQFADGGMMATKPYISSSNYVRKMSNFAKGDWCGIWDALYWRFVSIHADFFRSNPRLSIMIKQLSNMDKAKLNSHFQTSEKFLSELS